MRTLKLTLAYDGTEYSGWQSQTNAVSLQDTFEAALKKITGESTRVVASGRTDAGVHAQGQVVSFPTASQLPCDVLLRAFNNHLPRAMAVLRVEEAPPGFHAIRHARRKRYRYLLRDGKIPDVFGLRYAWQVYYHLDVPAMQQALDHLIGTHDFVAFQSAGAERESTVRTVFDAWIKRAGQGGERIDERGMRNEEPAEQGRGDGETENAKRNTQNEVNHVEEPNSRRVSTCRNTGDVTADDCAASSPCPIHYSRFAFPAASTNQIIFEICADGFLYNMVRTIVGSLIPIGRGQKPVTWLRDLIATKTRRIAGQTAPPQGLYLVEVEYGENDEIGMMNDK